MESLKRKVCRKLLRYYGFYLMYIKRGKLKKLLGRRKEKPKPFPQNCKDCPAPCCYGCENFDKETTLCKIWDRCDWECRTFPITPLQLEKLKLEDDCRFYWNEEDVVI